MRVKKFGAALFLLCALTIPTCAGETNGDIGTGRTNGDIGTGFAGILITDASIIISDLIGRLPRG